MSLTTPDIAAAGPMPSARRRGRALLPSLIGLTAVSIACVAVLIVAVAGAPRGADTTLELQGLLISVVLAGVVAFAGIAGLCLVRATRRATNAERRVASEVLALERRLLAADAIIRSEPQALLIWEPGQPPRVGALGLPPNVGVPNTSRELLRFGGWLDIDSATQLAAHLDRLLRNAVPFNLLLKTRSMQHVEADGRIAGGRAIMRIRAVVGQRFDLARMSEKIRQMGTEIEQDRTLFQTLPMAIWFRGPDGRITWVNDAYIRATGAASNAQAVENQVQLLEERQLADVEAAIGAGETYQSRIHVVVDGDRRAYDLIAAPVNGHCAFVATDVEALETAESALSRQTEANDRTLDRVSTAVAIFGPDQKLTFYNEAYRNLWHLDEEWLASYPRDGEILDRLREDRRLPTDKEYHAWKKTLLACYGTVTEFEDFLYLPDGRAVKVVAEQRPDGGVTYLYDDVTEQFALESKFNALSRVQRETIDHLREGVAVFATDGRLRLFNPAFVRIWKLDPDNLGDHPHIDAVSRRCAGNDGAGVWDRLRRAATALTDQRQRLEGQADRVDGSIVAYAGLPLPDGAMLFTFVDVTDTKRVESALRQRNEALEAADRLKNRFIQHVSYELRTPLTNIIGFTELLMSPRTGALSDKQSEYLNDIYASSRALQNVINDILDLATIDAGTLELKLGRVGCEQAVTAAGDKLRDRLSRTRLKLDIQLADDLPYFLGDPDRVQQILINLLTNAIGFSEPADTILVRGWNEAGGVAISVADQGPGIPPELQSRIFERFESHTHGSRHRGAGLGLAIVKSLVELHGGRVYLASEVGKGTTVTVWFPIEGPGHNPENRSRRRTDVQPVGIQQTNKDGRRAA